MKPTITIKNVTTSKISDEDGFDKAFVEAIADGNIVEFEARADGTGHGSGLLVGNVSPQVQTFAELPSLSQIQNLGYSFGELDKKILSNSFSFEIDDTELTNGEKNYKINIYAKNTAGEWTDYE